MIYPFSLDDGLIVVEVEVVGPATVAILRLALDTGATTTLINVAHLVALGYDPALAPTRVQITTGSGVEFVPRLPLTKIAALGQERFGFPVLCHTLPPSALIDGLLGLDFFHGTILTLDLKVGQIGLA
jgi:hypothetical protein